MRFAYETPKNRLVWRDPDSPPAIKSENTETLKSLEKKETFDPSLLEKELKKAEGVPHTAADEPGNKEAQKKVENELMAAYDNPEPNREIPNDLQKLSRQEVRNLERENPEKLFQSCFWKVEADGSLTPIESPADLKAGDQIRFYIPEADTTNKNLEMGAGLRIMPPEFNVVQIGDKKFYRAYQGGPFVDAKGEYRAVRSHEHETIKLLSEDVPSEIQQGLTQRSGEYRSADAANLLSTLANDVDDLSSPEFAAKIQKAKKDNPELATYLNVSNEDIARLNLKEGEASVSMRNNNPGNLKYIGQAGSIGPDERGFARFMTLEAGTLAHKNQIRIDAKREFTVLEFTKKYLGMDPRGTVTNTKEGDAVAYAKAITDNPNIKLAELIDRKGIDEIQKAMQKHESWTGPSHLHN